MSSYRFFIASTALVTLLGCGGKDATDVSSAESASSQGGQNQVWSCLQYFYRDDIMIGGEISFQVDFGHNKICTLGGLMTDCTSSTDTQNIAFADQVTGAIGGQSVSTYRVVGQGPKTFSITFYSATVTIPADGERPAPVSAYRADIITDYLQTTQHTSLSAPIADGQGYCLRIR